MHSSQDGEREDDNEHATQTDGCDSCPRRRGEERGIGIT